MVHGGVREVGEGTATARGPIAQQAAGVCRESGRLEGTYGAQDPSNPSSEARRRASPRLQFLSQSSDLPMRIPALAFAATLAAATAQSPLTTTFVSNNGGSVGGTVMFDLVVNAPTTITQIDVNSGTAASTPGTLEIRTCPTSFLGNELTPAAWTAVSSGNPLTTAGLDVPTPVTLTTPLVLAPGNYGVMLKADTWAHRYTNGTNTGNGNTYSTAQLTLNAGSAQNVEYTSPFNPRVANVSIHYTTSGGNFATKTLYGSGCYDRPRMVYEEWPVGSTIDLVNTSWGMFYQGDPNTGGTYLIVPGGAPPYDGVTPAALGIDLLTQTYTSSSSNNWDDASIVRTLPPAFSGAFPCPGPAPGQAFADITINSNGRIFLGNTTDTSFAANGANSGYTQSTFNGTTGPGLPVVAGFMCDLDPTVGGNIWYEDPSPSGGVRITWHNLLNWQDPAFTGQAAQPNFIQMELLPGGQINLAFGPSLGNGGSSTNVARTGFSPGFGAIVGRSIDWSAISGFQTGTDAIPLTLDASARPVLGTTITLTMANIPPATPLATFLFGLTKFDPGIPLAPIGMPGCFQYASQDVANLVIGPGATATRPFAIPANPIFAGQVVVMQAAAYNPPAVPNPLGVLSSNGVELLINPN